MKLQFYLFSSRESKTEKQLSSDTKPKWAKMNTSRLSWRVKSVRSIWSFFNGMINLIGTGSALYLTYL